MDPILVKGLREAKQLHDDGILSLQEFEKEKAVLLQKRDIRVQREAARTREGEPELRRYRSDGANNTFCSRCGLPGHNKRSCTEDLEALGGKKRRKKAKWDLLGGKRGIARPRWSREPTCYALFFGSELKKMKAEDTEKKLKISEAAKVVAAKWKTMSEEEKAKWKREKPAVPEDPEAAAAAAAAAAAVMGCLPPAPPPPTEPPIAPK